jgi:hypothetical protein
VSRIAPRRRIPSISVTWKTWTMQVHRMRHACLVGEGDLDALALPDGKRDDVGPRAAIERPNIPSHVAVSGPRESSDPTARGASRPKGDEFASPAHWERARRA